MGQPLVVYGGGLQFLFGIQIGGVNELAVRQSSQTRHPLVVGVVDIKVFVLHIFASLTPEIEPGEVDFGVALKPFADYQSVGVDPQTSSIKAAVCGQWASSRVAGCSDARMWSNVLPRLIGPTL